MSILVGKNNSGKSIIIDALLLIRCAFATVDILDLDVFDQLLKRKIKRDKADKSSNFRELYFMMDYREQIETVGRFSGGESIVQQWKYRLGGIPQIAVPMAALPDYEASFSMGSPQRRSVDDLENSPVWKDVALDTRGIGVENSKFLGTSHLVDPSSLHAPFLEVIWGKLFLDRRDRLLRDMANEIYNLEIELFNQADFGGYNRINAGLSE